MGFFRIIIWSLIFYFIYKTAVKLMKIFSENRRSDEIDDRVKKMKYEIKKDDIIEAKFEDIGVKDKSKNSA